MTVLSRADAGRRRMLLAIVMVLVATALGVSLVRPPGARAEAAWTAMPPLTGPRVQPVVTVLADGDILALGGDPPSGLAGAPLVSSAEVYDRLNDAWSPARPPTVPRADGFTATLLSGPHCGNRCGKVLVVGGRVHASTGPIDLAELYDPKCGAPPADPAQVQQAASACAADAVPSRLTVPRMGHTATLLGGPACIGTSPPAPSYCGKVLVVGGTISDVGVTASTELYDPVTGTWTAAGALPAAVGALWGHTATPLSDGRVVIVGGSGLIAGDIARHPVDDPDSPKAVVYDPNDPGTPFKAIPGPKVRRVPLKNVRNGALHTATAVPVPECDPAPPFVPCARLLVTGGNDTHNKTPWAEILELTPERQELKVAGAREAVTGGTFTLTFKGQTTGTLAWNATAAAVQEKLTALSTIGAKGAAVAGGPFPDMPIVVQFTGAQRDAGDQPPIVATSALTTSEDVQRAGATADVIVGEKVKGSNGWVPTGATVQRCLTADTRTCRVQHTASPLPGGRVLVAGGRAGTGNPDPPLASAEVFDPTATTVDPVTGKTTERGTWAASDPMSVARVDHTAVDLPYDAGKVVVVGGRARAANSGILASASVPTTSVEVFTPAADPAVADLAVTMVDTPDPVAVGEVLTYEATVTNAGPDTAAIPTLAVTLGARLVFESAEPAGICSLGANGGTSLNEVQRVTCRLGGIEKDNSVPVTIKARVASSDGPPGVGGLSGVIISSAQVSSPTPEPSESSKANNISYTSTTPIAARNIADVGLLASATIPPGGPGGAFKVGDEVIHSLTATNLGPDVAHGVKLDALVPAGATVTPSVGTTCTGATYVSCDIGELVTAATATIEVKFVITTAHTGRVVTTAVIRASEIDPVLTNNAASASSVVKRPDESPLHFNLKIESITATPDPAVVNKRISYTIKARNDGPFMAPNVVLQDYPRAEVDSRQPSGLLGTAAATETDDFLVREVAARRSGTAFTEAGGESPCIVRPPGIDAELTLETNNSGKWFRPGPEGIVTCLLGDLQPGEEATVIVAHDAGAAAGRIVNIAEVYALGLSVVDRGLPKSERDLDDNQLQVSTNVNTTNPAEPVDVWATMSDAPDPVAVGQDLTYTVEVGNHGEGQATSVTLEDPLPDGVMFKSVTTTKGTCAANNSIVRCDIGNLDEDERATVKIVVVAQASFASTISNVAIVSSLEEDALPANNVARATTTVSATQSSADLDISVADAPDPVTAGADLTYAVRVVNRGPDTSYNSGVTDTLPQGVSYRSSSASRGGCGHDSGTVTCAFGHLVSGAEATATIVVRPTSAGTVTNTARATSGTTDPDDTNNSATTQTTVNAAPATTTTSTSTPTTSTSTTSTSTTTTSTPSSTSTNPHANSRPREDVSKDHGYTLVGSDGGIFNYGTARFHGSTGGLKLNEPVIGMTIKPGGSGYWLVARDGGIFNFGDAAFFGSAGDLKLNAPILGMEATPSGNGYYLFGEDGGIFTFGDAKFHGSTGDRRLNAPVVGLAVSEKGDGYWLVGRDGGIFTFGNAPFHGSTGNKKLNEPVFDMAPTGGDKGYWLLARDGGIFSFGDVEDKFYGSAVGSTTSAVIGIAATPTFKGYWIADANGTVLPFGDATFLGDRRSASNNATIVGFATVPKN